LINALEHATRSASDVLRAWQTGELIWRRRIDDITGVAGVVARATPTILDCQSLATAEEVAACVREVPGSEDNHFDAIVALDLATGSLKWSHSMLPFDVWTTSCVFAVAGNEGNCTDPHGEDYDFGQGAIAYTALIDGKPRDLLAAGQKSGIFWAVDPEDGSVVWQTEVGPAGSRSSGAACRRRGPRACRKASPISRRG
jgi:outer membrane protein assembly factor BamB